MVLYKYLSPDRIDVLRNCKIRFSQPGALNDPFEVKPSFSKITTDEEASRTFDIQFPEALEKEYQELPRSIRRKVSFKDFLEEARKRFPNANDQFIKVLDEYTLVLRNQMTQILDEKIGILSLTQTPINKLMWAHYTDSYKGFVIGFDATHPFFDKRKSDVDEFGYLRKVEYHDSRPSLPMIELDGTHIFLIKGREWEYEEEWRMIRPLQEADEAIAAEPYPICLFKFPADIVSEIILGNKMPENKKTELITLVNSNFSLAKIYQAEVDIQDYNIRLNQL